MSAMLHCDSGNSTFDIYRQYDNNCQENADVGVKRLSSRNYKYHRNSFEHRLSLVFKMNFVKVIIYLAGVLRKVPSREE